MADLCERCIRCRAVVPHKAPRATREFHIKHLCREISDDELSEAEEVSHDSQHSHGAPASASSFFANSEGVVADLLDTLNLFPDEDMEEEWEGTMPQGIPDDVFDDANSLDGVSDDDDDDSYKYFSPLPISELEDEELVELCQPTALLERTLRGGQQVFPEDVTNKVTVKELVLSLMNEMISRRWTKENFDEDCKRMKHVFGNVPNNWPKSLDECKKILAAEDAWDYTRHYCPNHCKCFGNIPKDEWGLPFNRDETCGVNGCAEKRFESRVLATGKTIFYPRKYFFFFGVEKALRSWFARDRFCSLRAGHNARNRRDIWTGEYVKRMNDCIEIDGSKLLAEQDVQSPPGLLRENGLLDIGFDGAQIWNRRVYSVTFMVARPWDIPYEDRGKAEFTKLIGIIPGPNEGTFEQNRTTFMRPFVEEMQLLGREGITINDTYFKREYTTRWFLATVSADTPARNHLGGFMGVMAHMADWRSIFRGKSYTNAGQGTYFTGYHETIRQYGKDVFAWDESLYLDDKTSRRLASKTDSGELPSNITGRHGMSPLAELPGFDVHSGFLLPWIHACYWGVMKNFWGYILMDYTGERPRHVLPKMAKGCTDCKHPRYIISKLGSHLQIPSDAGRPYLDITRYRGSWVMENYLDWTLSYSPIAHGVLKNLDGGVTLVAWKHLRSACLHYTSLFGTTEIDDDEALLRRKNAEQHLRSYAAIIEKEFPVRMCTLNLHMLVTQSFKQEDETGPIMHCTEFWVERFIQICKRACKNKVVDNPEIFLANTYLTRSALDEMSVTTGDIEPTERDNSPNPRADYSGDPRRVALLGTGKPLRDGFPKRQTEFNHFLAENGRGHMKGCLSEISDGKTELLTFAKAEIIGEVIHSKEYLRTKTRCSTHVELAERSSSGHPMFAEVLRFHMLRRKGEEYRFCEVMTYETCTTDEDKYLQRQCIKTSSASGPRFLDIEKIKQKVMFLTPPEELEVCPRGTTLVLRHWPKGKI
jgi:hypothetical protein